MSRSHIGAALVMTAVLSAGAATAQGIAQGTAQGNGRTAAPTTAQGANGSDGSLILQQRLEQTRRALEAERDRRAAADALARDLQRGTTASESWMTYRQRQQQGAGQRKRGTMFYEQQLNR